MKKQPFMIGALSLLLFSQLDPAAAQYAPPASSKTNSKSRVMMIDPNCDPSGKIQTREPDDSLQFRKAKSGPGTLAGNLSIATNNNHLYGVIVSEPDPSPAIHAWVDKEQEDEWKKWLVNLQNTIFLEWQKQKSEQEQASLRVKLVFLNPTSQSIEILSPSGDTADPALGSALSKCLNTVLLPPPPEGLELNSVTFDVTAAVDTNRFPRKNAFELGCIASLRNGKELTVQSNGGTVRMGPISSTNVRCGSARNPEELRAVIKLVEEGKPIEQSMGNWKTGINAPGGITMGSGGSITVGGGGSITIGGGASIRMGSGSSINVGGPRREFKKKLRDERD